MARMARTLERPDLPDLPAFESKSQENEIVIPSRLISCSFPLWNLRKVNRFFLAR